MSPLSPLRKPFRYSYDNVTLILVLANVAVFFAMAFLPFQARNDAYALGALSLRGTLVNHYWWQLVSYMFVHDGVSHLLFNMIGLYVFGSEVERRVGSREFLLFYVLNGVLSGLFSLAVYFFLNVPISLVGASGAIFSLMLAFAAFYPDSRIYIWGILPVRAPILVTGYAALEIFSEVLSIAGRPDNVAHLTHLAGIGTAWAYFLVRYGINPWKRFFNR